MMAYKNKSSFIVMLENIKYDRNNVHLLYSKGDEKQKLKALSDNDN